MVEITSKVDAVKIKTFEMWVWRKIEKFALLYVRFNKIIIIELSVLSQS